MLLKQEMEMVGNRDLSPEETAERVKILQFRVLEIQIERIWREFAEAGFEPILIKGWGAAQLYPEPFRRQFSDIDLMVDPSEFEAATIFKSKITEAFAVDLHRGARHLDLVPFGDLLANAIIMKCGETKIRIPRLEDHLRILCVHWLNDGGADREKLWDIYYAIANRPENFDWERLLMVSPRRRQWIICAIGLAHRYLQLNIEDTPIAREAEELPRWLTKTVEREWKSQVRLQPLHYFLNNRQELWRQIKKRIPPNAIQATIETEGEFDKKPRIAYQLRSILPRLKPSIKRISQNLMRTKFKEI